MNAMRLIRYMITALLFYSMLHFVIDIPMSLLKRTISSRHVTTGAAQSIRSEAQQGNFQTMANAFQNESRDFPVMMMFGKSYIFSAIVNIGSTNSSDSVQAGDTNKRTVVITAWHHVYRSIATDYKCCIQSVNGNIHTAEATLRMHRLEGPTDFYDAVQFECHMQLEQIQQLVGIGMTKASEICKQSLNYYLQLEIVSDEHKNKLAVCMKHTHSTVDPSRLIEWFEAQIYLGVDKVFSHNVENTLSNDVMKVMNYYKSIGVAELIPFDLPLTDIFPRQLNNRKQTSYVDKRIPCLDCQERMEGYKYASFIDKDEIIVPERNYMKNSFRHLLDEEFNKRNARTAGFTFVTKVHITSWEPTDEGHELFHHRYMNSTYAFWDRWKYVYIPDRIRSGSCTAHYCIPKFGFRRYMRLGEDKVALHHYRRCRAEWRIPTEKAITLNSTRQDTHFTGKFAPAVVKQGILCYDFARKRSEVMGILLNEIADQIKSVRDKLDIKVNSTEFFWA